MRKLKMQTMNKRGQLALDVVESVVLKLLILAVLGVACVLALVTLQSGLGSTDVTNFVSGATNETTGFINQTSYHLAIANASTNTFVILNIYGSGNQSNGTQSAINNVSSGGYNVLIGSGNYSVNSTGWIFNTTNNNYGNTSVSYTDIYTIPQNRTTAITGNVTNGLVSFFGNAGTIFNILIAVVLISAVAIIILVVRRFAGKQVSA